jgi:hypothetical protein
MTKKRKKTGEKGEEIALDFLKKNITRYYIETIDVYLVRLISLRIIKTHYLLLKSKQDAQYYTVPPRKQSNSKNRRI